MTCRLGVLASHPIQYQAPLFRELAMRVDLEVFFAHRLSSQGQADAGFGVPFEWDTDLLGGYEHKFLRNRSRHPGVSDFFGCDTPQIAEEIRRGNFKAFLVLGWYLKSYWQAVRACGRLRVPVLVRGDSQLGTLRSRVKQLVKEVVYPRVLRHFDACLYVGEKNRSYLMHYGVPAARLFFSPHCVDNDGFASRARAVDRDQSRARWGTTPDQKVVLFVGKLLARKRPSDLVEALRHLRSRGIDVCGIFAGDGPLRGQLEATARQINVPVAMLGFRNQTELPEAYAMADVVVLPSSETWGLVVNEALACGTPVVVSDAVGCAPDLAIEGKSGAVYPAGDTQALANTLARILAAPPPRASIEAVIDAYSVPPAARGVLEAVDWVREQVPKGQAAAG